MVRNGEHQTKDTPPSVWLRVKGLLVDYLVIVLWMAIVGLAGFVLSLLLGGYPDYLGLFGPVGTQIIFFLVLTLPVGLYLFATESGPRHATFGKRKVGIAVVQTDGNAPTKQSILVRTIVKLLPWEIAHTFLWQMQYVFYQHGYGADVPAWILAGLNAAMLLVVLYVAMIAIRRDARGPHDLAAETRVAYR